jgi:hypothetical protein
MLKRVFLFLIILVAPLTFMSIAYSQMEKKTITLPSGEVVCNLNGEWDALIERYLLFTAPKEVVAGYKDIIKITQKGNEFVGIRLIGMEWLGKGTEAIRGKLDRNEFKEIQLLFKPSSGWQDCNGEMSKDCNKMVLDNGKDWKATLERK